MSNAGAPPGGDSYFAPPPEPDVAEPEMHPDINIGSRDEIPEEKRLPPGAKPDDPTHPLAVAALAASILWGAGVLSAVGIVLAGLAKRAIRNNDDVRYAGDRLARLATILGVLGIVASLAVFGVPRFLDSRDDAADATQVRAALVDAAAAQTFYLADHGDYADDIAALAAYRAVFVSEVGELRVADATGSTGFCIEGEVLRSGRLFHVTDRDATFVAEGACPAA